MPYIYPYLNDIFIVETLGKYNLRTSGVECMDEIDIYEITV